jgi:2-oxoisovalerate dehydrogenase E1 component alpha subunit
MSISARFEVAFSRFLAPDGNVEQELPPFARERDAVLRLYRAMVLTRSFDTRAIALQRTGRLGTYASSLGQEAVGRRCGRARCRPATCWCPPFASTGPSWLRGVTHARIACNTGAATSAAPDFAGRSHATFPTACRSAPRSATPRGRPTPSLRGEARAAVCFLGDGGSSKGDFYEGLNFAAVWKAPLLFVVSNNQWAISVPRSRAERHRHAGAEGHRRRRRGRAGRRQRPRRGAPRRPRALPRRAPAVARP